MGAALAFATLTLMYVSGCLADGVLASASQWRERAEWFGV
jgi:hypothetical protein